jgi:predicted permease
MTAAGVSSRRRHSAATWRQDARDALRRLRRSPGYTAATVTTLAVAIAANAAIFGVVHAVLLKPLPLRAPRDLVLAWQSDRARNAALVEISYATYERWSANPIFERAAAIGSSLWPAILRGQGEPVRVATAGVSSTFFETMGAAPALGRALRAEDDLPNAPDVAVLSHAAWKGRFASDPQVLGRTVELDRRRTIVGVMTEGFDFPRGADFWIPARPILAAVQQPGADPLESIGVLLFVGRLRPEISAGAAASALDALTRSKPTANESAALGSTVVVTPFLDYVFGPVRQGLWATWIAVAVLLLIACATVSGLTATRVAARASDQAIRVALGARRRDLARTWLIESCVIATVGGVLGLLLSHWLLRAIVTLAPGDVPRLAEAAVDWRVAALTLAITAAAAVLCALTPLRQAAGAAIDTSRLAAAWTTESRRAQRGRVALVIAQIALAVVLLVSAGLVVRSFVALRMLDIGFVPSNVVTMFVQAPSNAWMQQLLSRVRTTPHVEAAGAVYLRPLELGPVGQETSVLLEGQPNTPRARASNPVLNYQVATPGYFEAMRIRLVRGRTFTDDDRPTSTRVAIVGETAARRLWPGQDAIGKKLLLPAFADGDTAVAWRTVVGVVGDVHYRGLGDVRLDVYDAAPQSAAVASYVTIRTSDGPVAALSTVRADAHRLDASVVVDDVRMLDAVVARARAPWQLSVWMLVLLAAFGFALAAIGLFGVVALDVTNRQRDLAIRAALGAPRRALLRAVLVPAMTETLAGLLIGGLGAAGGTRAVRGLLFGVPASDAITWIGVFAIVGLVVGAAAYLPARRAAESNPLLLLLRKS